MQTMMAGGDTPTAVIVDNNLSGVGVVRCLLDAGRVPGRDISVIVYDGTPADSTVLELEVTAIEQPTPHGAGVKLAELMLGVMQDQPLQELQVLWAPRIGNSDGPAPGA
jgi:LacI family transcriptional regulator